MTIMEKQCLLFLLGLYNGKIDGIWGPRSSAAAHVFQQRWGDLTKETLDKIRASLAAEPEDWWRTIRYFQKSEFACKCGCGTPVEMDRQLITAADEVRKHFGVPVIVSSGLRCREHNTKVGGVSNSRHLTGKAMDFCVQGRTAADVLRFVQTLPVIRYAYAIDNSYVHMDVA